MQCVILAGGLATRMRPITDIVPKSLIPIGQYPFIHYQLAFLAKKGVRKIVLSIGYKGQAIREFVGDGSRWGIVVHFVDEGEQLRGTGGAIRKCLEDGVLEEIFLVTYGDSFLPIDYSLIWNAFLDSGKEVLMTVYRNLGQWDTSNVIYRNGKVVLYDKRPEHRVPEMEYIDYGLLGMKRSIVEEFIPSLSGEKQKVDLSNPLYSLVLSGRVAGHEVNQRFYEIGSNNGLKEFTEWAGLHQEVFK